MREATFELVCWNITLKEYHQLVHGSQVFKSWHASRYPRQHVSAQPWSLQQDAEGPFPVFGRRLQYEMLMEIPPFLQRLLGEPVLSVEDEQRMWYNEKVGTIHFYYSPEASFPVMGRTSCGNLISEVFEVVREDGTVGVKTRSTARAHVQRAPPGTRSQLESNLLREQGRNLISCFEVVEEHVAEYIRLRDQGQAPPPDTTWFFPVLPRGDREEGCAADHMLETLSDHMQETLSDWHDALSSLEEADWFASSGPEQGTALGPAGDHAREGEPRRPHRRAWVAVKGALRGRARRGVPEAAHPASRTSERRRWDVRRRGADEREIPPKALSLSSVRQWTLDLLKRGEGSPKLAAPPTAIIYLEAEQ
eukprot:jgi/Botrbrau1/10378/Bobra.146_2s0016.1